MACPEETCRYDSANRLALIRAAANDIGLNWPQCDSIAEYVSSDIEELLAYDSAESIDPNTLAENVASTMESVTIYTHTLWQFWHDSEAYAYETETATVADYGHGVSLENVARAIICDMASALAYATVIRHNETCTGFYACNMSESTSA
jgi:hypothetical protein